jgi:glucose/arabinose dehydrogenase
MLRITLTLLAVAVTFVLAFGPFAEAQQPAAPPTWKQGQPPSMADSPLAPIAQPPAPKAPGEIPVDKIKVPAGFKVALWAHGINNARVMTWGAKGTLFVSSRTAGNVYAVLDNGTTREVKVIAKGLNLPNGVAFKDGTLYIAEVSRITKMVGIEDKLDNARLEVPGLRTRRQAVLQHRRALQHLHSARHARQPLAREPGRYRVRVRRARRPQQRRLRLAPGDEGALLHHARARLARRRYAE